MTVLLLLSACSPTMDMQGHDPRDYYAGHPIKNTIETRHMVVNLHYEADQCRLSPSEIDRLSDSLHPLSMLAVDSIEVSFSTADKSTKARKRHLTKLLRNMGYDKGKYVYKPLATLKSGDAQLNLTYSVVVSPDCPDWRTSPVTTHSNTTQGNFGCAQQVDFGLMVADPHDLVRGTGDMPIDATTADKAVSDYHEGKGASAPAAAGSSANSPTTTTGQ